MIDFEKLKAPFPPETISWRVGSTNGDKSKGLSLAYVDARDVMERLDEVCGPAGWQCKYSHANGKTVCDIGIDCGKITVEEIIPNTLEKATYNLQSHWIWKADGAGDSDVEAEKGALSDAFKRAAVRWGIGRYLYEDKFKNIWVEIEPAGRSYKIKQSEYARLAKIAAGQKTTQPTPQNAKPPSTGLRVKNFEKAMAAASSMLELDKVIKNGNVLLAELHKSLPQAHDELQKKISQYQEAFNLQNAAE